MFKKTAVYLFVIICNCVLLFFIIFNLYTLSVFNRYKNKLNYYTSSIENANVNAFTTKNSASIDADNMGISITNTISSLSKLKDSIETSEFDDRYKADFDNLKLGLKNNIFMYKQLLAILKNLNSADITNSMKTVLKYKELCNYYYSNIKSKNRNFSLPSQCINNLNNTSVYIKTLDRQKKDAAIANTQKLEFENNVNAILEKFNSVKTNMAYYAENSRIKNMTYDNAISKVNQHKSDFNDILVLFSQINVPEEDLLTYNDLKNVLSDYNSYLNSFSSALNAEKAAASNSNNTSDFSGFYTDADSKYEATNKAYNTLKIQLDKINND